MNKTLGKTFIDNFQSQTQPQTPQVSAPTPLSTKAGLNKTKVTAMQQGVLQVLSNPQMGAMAQQNAQ